MSFSEYLNERAARAATDAATSDIVLTLMEIYNEGTDGEAGEIIRFALNDEDIVSNGEVYHASGFTYKPPSQGTEGAALGQLRIDNLDRSMSEAVMGLKKEPRVLMFEVLAAAPDRRIVQLPLFKMFNIVWDLYTMEASLGLPDDSDEPCVSFSYTPGNSPALYSF